MANLSNPPSNIKIYPIPGIGIEVHATFTQANGSSATYARFQISTDPNFGTTVYDSGQVSITPIPDGTEGTMIFGFISSNAGTYYYRLCFWDNSNYTYTNWTVWNGTTISESSEQSANLLPASDYGTQQLSINPTSPTTHYDKVDETTPDDNSTYVYYSVDQSSGNKTDIYNSQNFSAPELFKRITKVRLNIRTKKEGTTGYEVIFYHLNNSDLSKYVSGSIEPTTSWETTYTDKTKNWDNNDWNLSDLANAKLKIRLSNNNSTSVTLYVTMFYITIYYVNYVLSFTPPGNNVLIIGFPEIISSQVSNDKDKYTFQAVVSDTYTKPPTMILTVGNRTEVMNYIEKTGTGPYYYTFKSTISLEKGSYEYHYEIGNVWTTLIDDTRFLYADYTLNDEPKIEVFSGDSKINSWNHILTDSIIPDYPSIEFDTDTELGYEIEVRFTRKTLQIYKMTVQRATKIPGGYHITAIEKAKEDLTQLVSLSAQAKTSLAIIQNIIPNYIIEGNLPEVVYLQDFQDEQKANIIKRLLILNNAIGYIRNRKLFIYDMDSQDSRLIISKNDPELDFEIDYGTIVNKVREYYMKKAYPIPINLLTNYDASNWTGTVSNERQTSNGVLAPSGSPYILKGNGTISRSINFKWSEFDRMDIGWCPVSASSLEIRLATDSSNYRRYIRTFAGSKGAGFVLTSANSTDEVQKTINFSSKYIHKITARVSSVCSIKYVLKLNGVIVADTGYMTIADVKSVVFQNVLCDTIEVSFTNLYVVGTTYGVQCTNLEIEEYKQSYITTGVSEGANWHGGYSDSTHIPKTAPLTFSGSKVLGSAPSLSGNERFEIQRAICYVRYVYADGSEKRFYGQTDIKVENGSFVAYFNVVLSGVPDNSFMAKVFYDIDIFRIIQRTTGEYVWIYEIYKWQESYNLFDSISVPFSLFSSVGSPTEQINSITLIATGDNYYDSPYVYKSNPVPQYVEIENSESIKKGVRFQERKTDGWSSKESALAFATALVSLFGNPAKSYSKKVPLKTDINIGDMITCDEEILPVYKITYDLTSGYMSVFVGRSVTDTLEWLKETSRKIEAIQKTLY